jgi:hypothetical protein
MLECGTRGHILIVTRRGKVISHDSAGKGGEVERRWCLFKVTKGFDLSRTIELDQNALSTLQ